MLPGELDLDLFLVDLASVVSKYTGEAEKDFARIFAAAERGGAVLFVDEQVRCSASAPRRATAK